MAFQSYGPDNPWLVRSLERENAELKATVEELEAKLVGVKALASLRINQLERDLGLANEQVARLERNLEVVIGKLKATRDQQALIASGVLPPEFPLFAPVSSKPRSPDSN